MLLLSGQQLIHGITTILVHPCSWALPLSWSAWASSGMPLLLLLGLDRPCCWCLGLADAIGGRRYRPHKPVRIRSLLGPNRMPLHPRPTSLAGRQPC